MEFENFEMEDEIEKLIAESEKVIETPSAIDGAPQIMAKPEDSEEVVQETEQEKRETSRKKKEEDEKHSIIYAVKVQTNKEDKALELISEKIIKKKIDVYAVAKPHGLRGYVFIEAPDKANAEEAVFNLPYVKRLLPETISYEEIKPMVEPEMAEVNIEKGDIVEMIAEPFKKEKARVTRVDRIKGEAVVMLLGAAVPMPVTIKIDNIRVIRRGEEE